MGNHEDPCEICGEDMRGLGSHNGYHSKADINTRIRKIETGWIDSTYKNEQLYMLRNRLLLAK